MDNEKWPALSVEGVLLGANIAFLLAGHANAYIITSLTLVLFLYTIQSTSNNPRFLYLFPWNRANNIPTPSWDTWILRGLIVSSVFFFFWGAANSYWLAFLIPFIGLAFPLIWDHYIQQYNRRGIDRILADGKPPNL